MNYCIDLPDKAYSIGTQPYLLHYLNIAEQLKRREMLSIPWNCFYQEHMVKS